MQHPIKLKQDWFKLLSRIYKDTETKISKLPCFEHCPECLCERSANEKIYFLPFEMEYIQKRTGIDLKTTGAFWTIEIPVSDTINGEEQKLPVGLKDKHHTCPFLSEDNRCTIYKDRPFDCRSFPLMPTFHGNKVEFELEGYCPLVQVLGEGILSDFIKLYTRIWYKIAQKLPNSWKELYWYSSNLILEINDPSEHPHHVDLVERVDKISMLESDA